MFKLAKVLAFVVVVVLAASLPALAGPFGDIPPQIDAYKETTHGPAYLQTAHFQSFEWWSYNKRSGTWGLAQGSGDGTFPQADTVRASKILYIQYMHPKPPREIYLKSYNRKDLSDKPFNLKPGWIPIRDSSGKVVGQQILFKLEKPHSQHYIDGYLRLAKAERHNYSYGDVSFSLHLKTY
jgi:hypothetical protein